VNPRQEARQLPHQVLEADQLAFVPRRSRIEQALLWRKLEAPPGDVERPQEFAEQALRRDPLGERRQEIGQISRASFRRLRLRKRRQPLVNVARGIDLAAGRREAQPEFAKVALWFGRLDRTHRNALPGKDQRLFHVRRAAFELLAGKATARNLYRRLDRIAARAS